MTTYSQPTLFGIKNCDTVKKARKWLEAQGIDYRFHDFRADGITLEQVQEWQQHLEWATLINKRSTTWKQLSEAEQTAVMDGDTDIVLANPTLIKRPVLQTANTAHVGFKDTQYASLF